jgi:hypothetical protein
VVLVQLFASKTKEKSKKVAKKERKIQIFSRNLDNITSKKRIQEKLSNERGKTRINTVPMSFSTTKLNH